MLLPYLTEIKNTARQQIIEFGGINYGEDHRVGELAESENLRSDLYPCLSPRRCLGEMNQKFDSADGLCGGDDLFVASGGKIYRNREVFAEGLSEGEKTLLKMNTKLIVFPDKVYFNLNPEDDYELTRIEPRDWETNYKKYFTKNENTEVFEAVSDEVAPTWVTERYYRYIPIHKLDSSFDFFGGTLVFEKNKIRLRAESGYCLKKGQLRVLEKHDKIYAGKIRFDCEEENTTLHRFDMSGTNVTNLREGDCVELFLVMNDENEIRRVEVEPIIILDVNFKKRVAVVEKIIESYTATSSVDSSHVRFEAREYLAELFDYPFNEGFCDLFKPGDALKISGCCTNTENNLTLVVRDVTPTELVFDENVFVNNETYEVSGVVGGGFEIGEVTIAREVPDFDVVCEHNNRIWGADKEKIYSSALGDPTNFNIFEGLASDSFSVAVASDGDFTGCVGFSGGVLFFKEDLMYKLLGDYPANYMMNEYNVSGVKKGSSKSLVNIKERLFYHSNDGIYTYSGSVPTCISYNFGTRRYKNAAAGGFGSKYYISMCDENGNYQLFVYDTVRGIWLREENREIVSFAERAGEYMMLESSGQLLQAEANEIPNSQKWSAELCEMTEYINERKCYSKLYMRLDMEEGAHAQVEIRCDRGEWKTVWKSTLRTGYTANIVFKPTRCDRFSIRLSGNGDVIIRSLIREYEIGSEV